MHAVDEGRDVREVGAAIGLLLKRKRILARTDQPHTGCEKFAARFGIDALKFISSPIGKELQMRGINLKVVQSGEIKPGDSIKKL